MLKIRKTLRDMGRLKDIAVVLTRNGFSHFVARLDLLKTTLPLVNRVWQSSNIEQLSVPKRVAKVLEELGPTFVKLGQMLAQRPDLIPEEYISELKRLQDKVQPFDSEQAKDIFEEQLGSPIENIFDKFEETPIATGSIGQVHFATLKDGSEVVVKIKRPGIDKKIESDISLLETLAAAIVKYMPEYEIFRPEMIVEEFARGIRKELNFVNEASYMTKFNSLYTKYSYFKIPKIYWEYTTHCTTVLEKLNGKPITSIKEIETPEKCDEITSKLMEFFITQYFEVGFFHGDPHPGNILYLDNGQIGIIDFGSIGHLTQKLRDQISLVLIALAYNDIEMIIDLLMDIGMFSTNINIMDLRSDMQDFIDTYYGVPLNLINLTEVFTGLTTLARRHQIILPKNFIILGKSFSIISGVARKLSPKFNFADILRKKTKTLIINKADPRNFLKSGSMGFLKALNFITKLPDDIKVILRKIKTGSLQLTFKHQGLDNLIDSIDTVGNRLAFSIVIAAILVSSSLVISSTEFQNLGIAGYCIAGICGLWLAFVILRSGHL